MTLAHRAHLSERMDDADLDPDVYAAVVADLARVNAVTLAARPTIDFVQRAAKGRASLSILDVGYGDGDMLRRIERWAARHGLAVRLTGIDLNPRSERAARAHTPPGSAIRWRTGDYAGLAGEGFDLILSSLVAHHMTEAEIVAFVRFMEREAKLGWLVNDLLRHGFAYRGYPLLARLAGWHPIVRHDGQVSIARAFRPADWRDLLAKADCEAARVRLWFPFRLCVERRR